MKKNLYKMIAALAAIACFNGVLPAAINIGVTPGSWDIGTGANGEYTSPPFTIANNGEPVRVNIKASNSPDWRLSNMARLNAFSIKWRDTGDWSDIFTNDTTMFPHLASASQQPFTLKYLSPTYAIPPVNGTAQASNVTLTAVSSYMGNTWTVNGATLGTTVTSQVIAKDAVGDFHVAFSSNSPNHLMYSDMGGVPEVVPVTVPSDLPPNAVIYSVSPISLVMDASGRPHVLYAMVLSEGGARLQYAWRNGSVWTTITVMRGEELLEFYGDTNSVGFSLDTNGLPHIASSLWSSGNLTYLRYTGSEWAAEQIATSGYIGPKVSMMVDSQNVPHIAYQDDPDGDWQQGVYHAAKLNGEWVTREIVRYGDTPMYGLMLDGQNRPYIMASSYNPDGSNYGLNIYRQNSDGNWAPVCTVSDEISNGHFAVNLDANGYPRIIYNAGQALRYAQWTGVEWLSSDILSSIENLGPVVSGFDINDRPVVGYVEGHNIPDAGSVYSLNRAKLE